MASASTFPAPHVLQWPDYASMPAERLESRDPSTGEVWQRHPEMAPEQVQRILAALGSFWEGCWRRVPVAGRARVIAAVGAGLRERADELADLVHREMGKAVAEARAEVLKSAGLCDWYAAHAARIMNEGEPIEVTPPIPGASRTFYLYEPLGIILSIMPWNFPVWQVVRQLVPNLVAGNAVVLKHAPNVMGCASAVERIVGDALRQADLGDVGSTAQSDPAVFRSLTVSTRQVQAVLEHHMVRGVSLTGSERAGRSIAALAGALLKKCVVELGGNDGYVVLEDADLERVADTVIKARLLNMGQSCIGPKRVIVVDPAGGRTRALADQLIAKIKEREGALAAGPEGTASWPPLVHADARRDVAAKVKAAVDAGAVCLLGDPSGGSGDSEDSAFFRPVVLGGVTRASPSFDTEIFGPVVSLLTATSETDALSLHNASSFGLGSGVFGGTESQDQQHLISLASHELSAGMCAVNDFVRSDASVPFGGVKNSGLGRECGAHGVLEFVNVKSVSVGTGGS